ncbi:MAG: DALR anticodon-binding domain-containing protein, partial [Candidatus Micrarchaeia archaeon]
IVFSWDNALNLEANSGPYVLYTYARAQHILEKGDYKQDELLDEDYARIGRGIELELIKQIGRATEVFENVSKDYRPNTIADYVLELASLFSKFYEQEPVIKGGEARKVRLAIVYAVKQTIENALKILGIKTARAL